MTLPSAMELYLGSVPAERNGRMTRRWRVGERFGMRRKCAREEGFLLIWI